MTFTFDIRGSTAIKLLITSELVITTLTSTTGTKAFIATNLAFNDWITNNLGNEYNWSYTSSTYFSIRNEQVGLLFQFSFHLLISWQEQWWWTKLLLQPSFLAFLTTQRSKSMTWLRTFANWSKGRIRFIIQKDVWLWNPWKAPENNERIRVNNKFLSPSTVNKSNLWFQV